MLIDARGDAPRTVLECDVCIVGGGPAGITLARELDDGRRTICLLECGGLHYERRTQALLSGEATEGAYPPLEAARLGALGGSTHVWAGWCRPLDPIDFERRDGVPSSGWPISRTDLDPFYEQAHERLNLGPFDYEPATWERDARVSRLPISGESLNAILFRRSTVSFARRYANELRQSQTVRTYLHANVLQLRFAAGGRRVSALEVAASDTGHRFEVLARTVVLAAGGIENARLLLLSAAGLACGPGNAHGLVGRYFTEHGYVDAGHFTPERPCSLAFHFARSVRSGAEVRSGRGAYALSATAMRRERLLNCALSFRPAYEADPVFRDPHVQAVLSAWDMYRGRALPHKLAAKTVHAIGAPHKLLRALWCRLRNQTGSARTWRLRALVECSAEPENRIELGSERDCLGRPKVRVRWSPSDADVRSVMRAHALFAEALRGAGIGRLILLPDEPARWRTALEPALHHLGTTRMHDDPSRGVVDRNSRVHGIDNLYVAGGSVFTTGGFANPTLTILALTLRLAVHLSKL